MHILGKFSLAAPLLALTTPLMAGVLVSSPVNGSTITSPVIFQASATTTVCSKGVGSMGVYVDNALVSVTYGGVVNSRFAIAPGLHKTVVEEWDKCGGASYSKMYITVAAPPAVAPGFSLPSGTYTSVQSVALSDATPGAIIYYTTDGTIPTTQSNQYRGAIPVVATQTINAIAVAVGYTTSAMGSAAYAVTLPASAPTFSLPAGTYTSVQSVALIDTTPGAILYYTTNGTIPTTSSNLYTGAIPLTATETINAIAVASGYISSAVASAAYTVTLPTAPPIFSLPAGTYTSVQSVALIDTTPGARIYYTTNGTTPTTSSTPYFGAIPLTATTTINAIAVASAYSNSAIASAAYTVTLPTTPPTFSLPAGTYTSVQSVALIDITPGAIIYYTTNGTTPTTSSNPYIGPITVSATQTINAMAVASAYSNSSTASAAYTVTLPAAAPRFSLPAGAYTSVQAAILSDATPGATIYYTMDGTIPTTSSFQYVNAIPVSNTETINAIAAAPNYTASPVASAAYTVTLPAVAPVFSVATGTYTTVQSVVLSDATPGAAIYYTFNGSSPSVSSIRYTGAISVGVTESIMAIAVAPNYTNSGVAEAFYTIKLSPPGPVIPDDAISASELQIDHRWKFNHDAGTKGTSVGAITVVSDPSLSGDTAEFNTSYTDWGGEIYHLSYGIDAVSSNFVYDAQIWIEPGSQIGNIEMDMNQVIANGDTVIFGFQCDGDHGTWDYSGNVGAISVSRVSWMHSKSPCKPSTWSTNTWHHVQISYSRDDVGNVTYNSVWLDGVVQNIGATIPSAQSLGWAHGDLLTNFQIDGIGMSGASVLYLDDLIISRW